MGYIGLEAAFLPRKEMLNKTLKKIETLATKSYHVDTPFIILSHTVLRHPILGSIMRSKVELYLYLRTWIVRGKMYNDKLNLLTNYYKKGKLASSVPIDDLAKEFHLGTEKILCFLNAMNYYGVITIKKIKPKDAYDKKPHNVYIFGEHNQMEWRNNEEIYYIDIMLQ